MQPWYLTPQALTIIARLRSNPPKRLANTSTNPLLTNAGFVADGIEGLRAIHAAEFNRLDIIVPWPREEMAALSACDPDEVLAGLFGDPDNLDWAHPERAARRTAIALEIDEALAAREAA